MAYVAVTFQPGERTVAVSPGTDLLTALIRADIPVPSSCGGKGTCGRCKVRILHGEVATEPTGKVTPEERAKGIVLACRTFVRGTVVAQVLWETRPAEEVAARFFEKSEEFFAARVPVRARFPLLPLTRKFFLRLPPPSHTDSVSDLDRVWRALQAHRVSAPPLGLASLRKLPGLLRHSSWEVTVTVAESDGRSEIILTETGDTSKKNYGVAVDVGTTTIAASLVDLCGGNVVRTEVTFNRQSRYGDDIISRIIHAEKGEGLEQLHHLVIETINEVIRSLAAHCRVGLDEITCVVCSGNMTMIHLLLKIDPAFLRREPYVPCATLFPALAAADAGFKINPSGVLRVAGGPSAYVGGDISSDVLATGMFRSRKTCLLIDVGTNGEIVLGNRDWLVCCSASAGPAFEGSGVTSGMRAVAGAVQGFRVEKGRRKIATIADAPAQGICGSGYIEILAELLRLGVIDRAGMIHSGAPLVRESAFGPECVVVPADEAGSGADIVITQSDIQNLLRAKAAIYAAMSALMKSVGTRWEQVERVYIAGGFGTTLNIRRAVSIGLLPDIPARKFRFMGNTSLLGAQALLLSARARETCERIAAKMTYIDLSRDPAYMDEYFAALFLPHTRIEQFPSVSRCVSGQPEQKAADS